MDLKEAFATLASIREWYKPLGIKKTTANAMVNRFKNDGLTEEKMREVLKLSDEFQEIPAVWKYKPVKK